MRSTGYQNKDLPKGYERRVSGGVNNITTIVVVLIYN